MKVFISWSGTRSRKIAECLKDKLSLILQTTTFFVSSKDINSGTLWRTKVAEELRTSDYGIICLTEENISNPWILFESGALSKKEESRVIPLCFGFNLSKIPPPHPLSAFQGKVYSKEKIKEIVESLNFLSEYPRDSLHLNELFDLIFSSLDEKVTEYLLLPCDNTEKTVDNTRTCDDIISEFKKSNAPEIVKSLLSWGYDISKIVRTGQKYNFVMEDTTLKKDGSPAVKITGTHIYTVINQSYTETLKLSLSMKDELGIQSVEDCWGLENIFYAKNDDEYKPYPLEEVDYGHVEKKSLPINFDIPPQEKISFRFVSAGVFLPSDKYIWYSQEFCQDCEISIINNTTISDYFRFQINHRDENRIKSQITGKGKGRDFIFGANIYPREGFTMYWKEKANIV
jgi:hypothetical protein